MLKKDIIEYNDELTEEESDILEDCFDEEMKEEKYILTDNDVLFTISYLSENEDTCTEGFFTKRFAAEIAIEEAKKAAVGTWIDVIETRRNKNIIIGTFKVTEDLVGMKIINKEEVLKTYEELALDKKE